jgi:hypothetical protein
VYLGKAFSEAECIMLRNDWFGRILSPGGLEKAWGQRFQRSLHIPLREQLRELMEAQGVESPIASPQDEVQRVLDMLGGRSGT